MLLIRIADNDEQEECKDIEKHVRSFSEQQKIQAIIQGKLIREKKIYTILYA